MRGTVAVFVTLLFLCHATSAAVAAHPHKFWMKRIPLFRGKDDSENAPSPHEFFRNLGYQAESHTVKTPDGYFLGVHRVYNQTALRLFNRPEPIMLQHGLFSNSAQWILMEKKQNFVAMLADAGYDCWMTNIRGNRYSKKHESLSPDSADFWDYEWHDNGVIDLPVMIDYILNRTGYKQLWYAGHSMGTTMFFVMASMKPEYNNKIKHMFALSPGAYMGKLTSPVRKFAPSTRALEEVIKRTMNNHIPPDYVITQAEVLLPECQLLLEQCGRMLHDWSGFNSKINVTVLLGGKPYLPDAASVKQLVHYAQGVNNPDTFRLYDYYEKNMEIYGSSTPPDYSVERITAPMTFMYATDDTIASGEDVENFSKTVKNVKLYIVPDKGFNHMDFIIGTTAPKLVYTPVIATMNKSTRIEKLQH